MKIKISAKHLKLEQTNSTIVATVAVAVVITVFSLISAKSLLLKANHQRHVINARNSAVKQLEGNVKLAQDLKTRFEVFNNANPNILGGVASNNSQGPSDGKNARIVLDALPGEYDFPALASSLEKIVKGAQLGNANIGGTDESTTRDSSPSANPQPVAIPVTISGAGSAAVVEGLLKELERSIRPFDVTNLEISGSDATMQITLNMTTYYQQAKLVNIGSKAIK